MDIDIQELIGKAEAAKDLGPIVIVRELVEADLELVRHGRGPGGQHPKATVKRLRERHHALARFLAEGKTVAEAAALTGYSLIRINILKADPAMKDLINHYRGVVEEAYFDMHNRLKGLSIDALDIIRDRIEENPDLLSTGQLTELLKLGADRTGHGPSSQQTNFNVTVNMASRLEAARKRIAGRRGPKIIEGTAEEVQDDAA